MKNGDVNKFIRKSGRRRGGKPGGKPAARTDAQPGSKPEGLAVKIIAVVWLIVADAIMLPLFLAMISVVIAFGAVTLYLAAAGVMSAYTGQSVTVRETLAVPLPPMPHICALFTGIAVFSVAGPFGVLTEYCRLHATQILLSFIRWHRNLVSRLSEKGRVKPPLPLHPWIGTKKREVMRVTVRVSIIVFIIAVVLGICSMVLAAKSVLPWRVWQWFE